MNGFLSFFALLCVVTAQKGAYFILDGGGMPLVIERIDPILSPGGIGGHVHSIVGGNGFNATMDFAQTQTSTCASVGPIADKSNYWMPNLYFHDPNNGSFIRVPEQPFHKIYYKYGNGASEFDSDIVEFPKEFRMVAGNPLYRSDVGFDMGPYGSELGWACHGGNDANHVYHPDLTAVGFPTGFTACPNGLAAAITMPSCWNGKDFDLANPYAHMAYPTADTLAGCPATHQVARFPQIFLEYWLNINTFDGLYTAEDSPFVLSMGDPTGYGFHLDFINGWEVGVLNAIMPTCAPGNTDVPPLSDSTCFGKQGGVYTDDERANCTIAPTFKEDIGWTYGEVDNPDGGVLTYGGVLDALPGCNPIQTGPAMATPQKCQDELNFFMVDMNLNTPLVLWHLDIVLGVSVAICVLRVLCPE